MLRLHIAPPGAGESLSSVVDRAAGLFNVSRLNLTAQLGRAHVGDPDFAPYDFLVCLADAMDIPLERLESLCPARTREMQLVRWIDRHAYCPLCMAEDLSQGLVPWFRLDWGRLWMTHCARHGTPLAKWGRVSRVGQRMIPHAFYVPGMAAPDWFEVDRARAEAWREASVDASAYAIWHALCGLESSWSAAGIGGPFADASDVDAQEAHLARLAMSFMAIRRTDKACLGELLCVPPGQAETMHYSARWPRVPTCVRNQRDMRTRLADLPSRRMVFALVGWSFGGFEAALELIGGKHLPACDDPLWIETVLSFQNAPPVRRALTLARDHKPFVVRRKN